MEFFKTFDVIDKYRPLGIDIFMIIGGRNTGKTFSALKEMADRRLKYFYVRRTETQVKIAMRGNIYSKIAQRYPEPKYQNITCEYSKDISFIYDQDDNVMAYAGSLNTMHNLTGADFSSCKVFFWDEFIRKKNERRIMEDELDSFQWAYETVSRNRELEGEEPLLAILCSNANTITNDLFIGLGIVGKLEECIKNNEHLYVNYEGRFLVLMLETPEELLEARKQTTIAKFSKGTKYYETSINNEFASDDFNFVTKMSIKGFKPLCKIDRWYLWEKKNDNLIYVTFHKAKVKDSYNLDIDVDRIRLIRNYPWLTGYYEAKRIRFESIELKEIFLALFFNKR